MKVRAKDSGESSRNLGGVGNMRVFVGAVGVIVVKENGFSEGNIPGHK